MKYKGIEFDDYTIDTDNHMWANICQDCVAKNKIPNHLLDRAYEYSTCSVKGCNNETDFYIDFPDIDLEPSSGEILGYIPNIVEFSKEEKKHLNRYEREYLKVRGEE